MHIFFSGIGGSGIGPLALIAHQAGYEVSGSDAKDSAYIAYLKAHGISGIHIGQSAEQISAVHAAKPIDWYVYSAAVGIDQPDAPEFVFCKSHGIRMSMRDELLNKIIEEKQLKLLAIAGTHGKTTTTAMLIWLCKQLGVPVSYSVGAKLSFGEAGHYEPGSQYFVYEADEYARNFLAFHPYLSIITGVDWDHPDIYPTRGEYEDAFRQFIGQNQQILVWQPDHVLLGLGESAARHVIDPADSAIEAIALPGLVNRQDAWQVIQAGHRLFGRPVAELQTILERFPGVARRFETIAPNLYTDYAHTPPKIRGALQLAHEVAGDEVAVVYEGLHNTRQHFIKDDLRDLFDGVARLVIVPTFLAREDPSLTLLSPDDLKQLMNVDVQTKTKTAMLDADLKTTITQLLAEGKLVLCISAGGAGSLDEWLRREFAA